MSAFVVSKQHIDALVSVAAFGPRDAASQWRDFSWARKVEPHAPMPDYPQYVTDIQWMQLTPSGEASLVRDGQVSGDEMGFLLWAENVASVSHRYPDDTPETLPGTMVILENGAEVAECTQGYKFERIARAKLPTTVEALKLIACLDYQSCEHDGWKDSEAFRILEALKDSLITCLAGYSAAAWEYNA